MRKYMFRGKTEEGKWVYGDLIIEKHGTFICDNWETGWSDDKVEPSSVGLFSGLYDREGNPVFDGDILRWTDDDGEGHFFQTLFIPGGFITLCPGQDEKSPREYLSDNMVLQPIVVGNMHDNAELMGEERK